MQPGLRDYYEVGASYTRADIRESIGQPRTGRGGDIDTGYFTRGTCTWILCGVGTAGRTGHNYGNHLDDGKLVWFGKTQSSPEAPSIRVMLQPDAENHIFYRTDDRSPFTYAGLGKAIDVSSRNPVRVVWNLITPELPSDWSPNEVPQSEFTEGHAAKITVNRYERDRNARDECVKHYGSRCQACGLEMGAVYGDVARGYIHVHHLVPLSSIGSDYKVDPVRDLRPLCPNCHSAIHRKAPPLTIEQLRIHIAQARGAAAS